VHYFIVQPFRGSLDHEFAKLLVILRQSSEKAVGPVASASAGAAGEMMASAIYSHVQGLV
jgi:hypothetical protein